MTDYVIYKFDFIYILYFIYIYIHRYIQTSGNIFVI